MNENVEYIIRIVLKARDEISGDLRKLRNEIDGMESDFDGIAGQLERVNKGITSLNTRSRSAIQNLRDLKRENEGLGDSLKYVVIQDESATKASKGRTSALSDERRAEIQAEVVAAKSSRTKEANKKATKAAADETRRNTEAVKADVAALRAHLDTLDLGAKKQAEVAQAFKDAEKARRIATRDMRAAARGERLFTEEEAKVRRQAALDAEKKARADLDAMRERIRLAQLEFNQQHALDQAREASKGALQKEVTSKRARTKASKDQVAAETEETEAIKKTTAASADDTVVTERRTRAKRASAKASDEETAAVERTTRARKASTKATQEEIAARFEAQRTGEQQFVDAERLPGTRRRRGQVTTVSGVHTTPREEDAEAIRKGGFKPGSGVFAFTDEAFRKGDAGTFPGAKHFHQIAVDVKINNPLLGSDREISEFIKTIMAKELALTGKADKSAALLRAGHGGFISDEGRIFVADPAKVKVREDSAKAIAKETVETEKNTQATKKNTAAARESNTVKKGEKVLGHRASSKSEAEQTAAKIAKIKREMGFVKIDEPSFDEDFGDDEFGGADDLDFGGGFPAIGGGAPRKKKTEKSLAAARQKVRSKELQKLAEIKVQFDAVTGSVGAYFAEVRKGNRTESDWIFKMSEAEKTIRKLARQTAQLTLVDREHATVIRRTADTLKERIALLQHPSTGEELRSAIIRNPVGVNIDDIRKQHENVETVQKTAVATAQLGDANEKADRQATKLHNTFVQLRKELDDGRLSQDEAIDRFKLISQELGRISRRSGLDNDTATAIALMGREAREASDHVSELDRSQRREADSTRRTTAQQHALSKEIDGTLRGYDRLIKLVDDGNFQWREARVRIAQARDELTLMARRSRGRGVDDQQMVRLGLAADHASDRIRRLTHEQEDNARKSSGVARRLENFTRAINRQGNGVAALDNQLRGLLVLAVITFAQQLITSLVGLVGAFGAVASSAAAAGAAIGGVFAAGLTQALPLIGLIIASLARLKSVMDVVKQSNLVDQQSFTRQATSSKKLADTTDAVANAQDGLRAANQRLADAHRNLTERQNDLNAARQQAKRDLRDLIQAERDAELAARGAALSQAEAQDALRRAVSTGDVEGLQRAELGVLEANQGRRSAATAFKDARAARNTAVSQGVEGAPGVVQAKKQIDDAKRNIADAAEAVNKAERGIDKARRGATAAAADQFTAAAALEYMLSKLSPAERKLYESIQRINKTFRENFRPITDILVNEFSKGVDTVDALLKDNRILRSAASLATGLAREIGKFRKEFTGPDVIRQFLTINRQAKQNLVPVGTIFRQIGRIWLNIAEAAGPSLTRVLEYFVKLFGDIRKMTDDQGRMERFFSRGTDSLLKLFDAIVATVKVFAALIGIGQSTGDNIIEDYTNWANKLAESIKRNQHEVHKFFEDSRKVFYQLIQIVAALTKALFEIFNPDRTTALATFLTDTLIPALVIVIKFVGGITNLLFKLLNLPIVRDLAKWGIAFLLFSKVVSSTTKLLALMAAQVVAIEARMARMMAFFNRVSFGRFNTAVGGLQKGLGGVFTLLGRLLSRVPLVGAAFTRMGARMEAAGAATTAAAAVGGVRGGRGTPGVGTPGTQFVGSAATGFAPVPIGGGAAEPRTPTRGGRIARGVGITALIGAGIAAHENATATRKLDKAPEDDLAGRGSLALDNLTNAAASLLSLDIKGFFNNLNRDAGGFADFAKSASDNLERFTSARNVKGLTDLANKARDFAETSPQYAEDLNKLADSAEKNAGRIKDQNKNLADTADLVKTLRRVGITIDVKTRGATPKALLEDVQFFMANLKKGVPRNFSDLRKEIQDQLSRINDVFAKNGVRSNDWYKNAAATYEVAIDNLKRLRREGKISEEQYTTQVRNMRHQLRLFNADVGDSNTFGKAFADKIRDGKGDRTKAISDVIKDLADMPYQARRQAAAMAIAITHKFEEKRPEMRGAAKRLAAEVGTRWRAMRDINVTRAQQMVDGTAGAIGSLPNAVSSAVKDVGTVLNKALKPLGAPPVHFSVSDIGKTPTIGKPLNSVSPFLTGDAGDSRAQGGILGQVGEKGKDLIHTVLGRGEMVLNSFHQRYIDPAVQAFYGHPLGKTFNRLRGYHAGGPEQVGFSGGFAGKSPAGFDTVAIPGFPGEFIAKRVVNDAVALARRFHMLITDAFATAGHTGKGHLFYGTAMDTVPGPGGNWAMVNKAVAYAVQKGLTVLYDGRFGSRKWPNHGEGLHAHFELQPGLVGGGSVDSALDTAMQIPTLLSPRLSGRASAARTIGQRTINRVTAAANRLLRRRAAVQQQASLGDTVPGGPDFGSGSMEIARTIVSVGRALRASPKAMLAAIETGIVESGLQNLNYGDRDSLGVFQQRPSQGWGTPSQVRNVRYAATQFFRRAIPSSDRYRSAGELAQSVQRSGFPGRYDQVRGRAAGILHSLGAPGFAAGGQVPGPTGKAVNIVAHAGEWVLNHLQQSRLASMLGLDRDTLRQAMGFSGSNERGYAGGGEVGSKQAHVLLIGDSLGVGTERYLKKRIPDLLSDVLGGRNSTQAIAILKHKIRKSMTEVILDIGTNDATASMLAKNLGKAVRMLSKGQELVISTVSGPGAAAKNKVLRAFAEDHPDTVRLVDLARTKGIRRSDGIHTDARGYQKRAKVFADAIKAVSADSATTATDGTVAADEAKLDAQFSSKAELKRLANIKKGLYELPLTPLRNWEDVVVEVKRVMSAMSHAGNNLKTRLANLDAVTKEGGLYDLLTQSRGRATAARARLGIISRLATSTVGGILSVRQRNSGDGRSRAELDSERALANARADLAEIAPQEDLVTKTRNKVIARLKALKKGGIKPAEAKEARALETQLQRLNDQFDEIRQASADATEAVFNAQVEAQQATIDRINSQAERQTGSNDVWKRFFTAVGQFDVVRQLNEAQVGVLQSQASQLEGEIAKAQAMGNEELAQQLAAQVVDLRVSAFELTQQILRDAMDQINQQASRRLGRIDLFGRMADALGAVGLDNGVNVGGEVLSRRQVFAARGDALATQRSGLQGLVSDAAAQGNMQLVQDLTDQLAELDVQIAENTKALFDAKVDDVNSRTSYALGIKDLNKRIVELNGQITGITDYAQLTKIAQDRQSILEGQRDELNRLLNDATLAGNQKGVQDLTQQLLENKVALLENTVAINELTGVTTSPQTFTSSAWALFREAIFSGMGQVLPQYNVSQMANGPASMAQANPAFAPTGSGALARNAVAGNAVVNEGDVNVNLYGYDRPVDPVEIAGVVGFARKTSQ